MLEVDLQVVSGQLRICGAAPDRNARTEHLMARIACPRFEQLNRALLAVRPGIVALTSNAEAVLPSRNAPQENAARPPAEGGDVHRSGAHRPRGHHRVQVTYFY